jgi:hypothetical protein
LDERGWTTDRRSSRKGFRLLDVAARVESPDGAAMEVDAADGAAPATGEDQT